MPKVESCRSQFEQLEQFEQHGRNFEPRIDLIIRDDVQFELEQHERDKLDEHQQHGQLSDHWHANIDINIDIDIDVDIDIGKFDGQQWPHEHQLLNQHIQRIHQQHFHQHEHEHERK